MPFGDEEIDVKILCPFCNALWNAKMVTEFYSSMGCPTCGPDTEGSIEIQCSKCGKTIYKKEYK